MGKRANLDARLDAVHKAILAQQAKNEKLDYPPPEDSPEYPAWLKKADAWAMKEYGTTWDVQMEKALSWAMERFG